MKAYSQDLRKRILETVQRGDGTLRQIARRFLVSVSFVTRLLQLHRSTGSLEPRPYGGGNPAVLGPEDLEQLRNRPVDRILTCHGKGPGWPFSGGAIELRLGRLPGVRQEIGNLARRVGAHPVEHIPQVGEWLDLHRRFSRRRNLPNRHPT